MSIPWPRSCGSCLRGRVELLGVPCHQGDGIQEVVLVEWLPENWHACRPDRASGEVVVGGDEDDREPPAPLAQLFFHFESADTGQADVHDRAVGLAVLSQIRFAGLEQVHFVTVRAQRPAHGTSDVRVIVNHDECQMDPLMAM